MDILLNRDNFCTLCLLSKIQCPLGKGQRPTLKSCYGMLQMNFVVSTKFICHLPQQDFNVHEKHGWLSTQLFCDSTILKTKNKFHYRLQVFETLLGCFIWCLISMGSSAFLSISWSESSKLFAKIFSVVFSPGRERHQSRIETLVHWCRLPFLAVQKWKRSPDFCAKIPFCA